MINRGKRNLLGVLVDAVDEEGTVEAIVAAAREGRSLAVTALAVHGVMTGVGSSEQRFRLNSLDLVCPDGQPVRWGLNLLHGVGLTDRVYGPDLMLAVCRRASAEGMPVYFYGSSTDVLSRLEANLRRRFPALVVAGSRPSRFRRLEPGEEEEVARAIMASGARILFVGLGCPRQEVFAYEMRGMVSMPILAVGAAFPFHAGLLAQAPPWMQRRGLEWLFRLWSEPRRLWRRYILLNPAYTALLTLQLLRLHTFPSEGREPRSPLAYG